MTDPFDSPSKGGVEARDPQGVEGIGPSAGDLGDQVEIVLADPRSELVHGGPQVRLLPLHGQVPARVPQGPRRRLVLELAGPLRNSGYGDYLVTMLERGPDG